jgi:hypothetical protein
VDDAIEAEGGNRNVRIWGNYLDATFTGIAHAATSVGPLYVFRNVMDRSKKCPRQDGGYVEFGETGPFGKFDDDTDATFSGGRRYILQNTTLQRPGSMGANAGLQAVSDAPSEHLENAVVRNNVWNTTGRAYRFDALVDSVVDHDLAAVGAIGPNSLPGRPEYVDGEGDVDGARGMYRLAPGSLGYDQGEALPNINDGYTGTAPDMGAHEAGTPRLQFGIDASAGLHDN